MITPTPQLETPPSHALNRSIHDLMNLPEKTFEFYAVYDQPHLFEGNYQMILQATGSFVLYHQSAVFQNFELCFDLRPQFAVLHFQLEGNFWGNFVEGNEYSFAPLEHNIYIVNQDFNTQNTFLPQKKLDFLSIYIPLHMFWQYLQLEERFIQLHRDKIAEQKSFMLFEQNLVVKPSLRQTITQLLASSQVGMFRNLYIESKIMEILALQLHQYHTENQDTTSKSVLKPTDIEKLHLTREFLQENFLQPLSLQRIAREAGLNEFKLKKGFKEVFGDTVFSYLSDLKMAFAYQRLQEGKQSISEIAELVGFRHAHHFTQAFKKKYGVAPSQIIR